MKILWLTNIPSPYRVKFFNELGKYCDLTVLFEKSSSTERDESWKNFNSDNFKAIVMQGKSTGVAEAFCPEVIKYIKKSYDHIVVTNYADPTGILAIMYMKIMHIKYEIEGDGAFPKGETGIKAKIKNSLFEGAVRYFSSGKLHDEYYKEYGVDEKKIVRYPFTSVKESEIVGAPISKKEKEKLKQLLNIKEDKMVLAVGQFIPRKGYDILLESFKKIDKDCGLYIVGGKAPKEYTDYVEKYKLKNVHFIDFMISEKLKDYYKAADLFVHPTREDIWGLVVNEAMASGLPVITTDRCLAGLEMVDGSNGKIVHVENVEELTNAIELCIKNSDMSDAARKTALKYTTENMVKFHLNAWKSN